MDLLPLHDFVPLYIYHLENASLMMSHADLLSLQWKTPLYTPKRMRMEKRTNIIILGFDLANSLKGLMEPPAPGVPLWTTL